MVSSPWPFTQGRPSSNTPYPTATYFLCQKSEGGGPSKVEEVCRLTSGHITWLYWCRHTSRLYVSAGDCACGEGGVWLVCDAQSFQQIQSALSYSTSLQQCSHCSNVWISAPCGLSFCLCVCVCVCVCARARVCRGCRNEKKKTRSVQYALQWRLVGNRWRLVGNQWQLEGNCWG